MTKVEFPENSELKIIGKSTFEQSSIEYIKIPPYVTEILDSTFYQCSKLKQVDLVGNSLKRIEMYAFARTNITSISIPLSVIYIHYNAFYQCFNFIFIFNNLKFNRIHTYCSIINESYIKFDYNEIDKTAEIVGSNYNGGELLIPKLAYYNDQCYTVIGFKENALKNNKYIKFFNIQNNCEFINIGKFAFSNSIISDITIPSSVTIISEGAFEGCSNLKDVYFKKDSQLQIIESIIIQIKLKN